jgi:hypothetical protein
LSFSFSGRIRLQDDNYYSFCKKFLAGPVRPGIRTGSQCAFFSSEHWQVMNKFATGFSPLRKLLAFVALGVATAAPGELQFSIFIRGDVANFRGAMVVDAIYLGLFFAGISLFKVLTGGIGRGMYYGALGVSGAAGLAIEWSLIGNSPWDNPQASQLGMFAYWACMAGLPVLFAIPAESLRGLRRGILLGGSLYLITVSFAQAALPSDARFAFHIWTFILGYLSLFVVLLATGRKRVIFRPGQ